MVLVLETLLPPKGLWVTELALTMLTIACNGRLRIEENKIIIEEPALTVSKRLDKICDEIKNKRVPVNPRDASIMNMVLKSLGVHASYQDPNLTKNLADALKRFMENPIAYPDALKPMKPLTPFKAEYKEFMRSFGAYSGSKTIEGLLIPPFIQALGLLGLVYTEYYRVPGEGKTIHLTLLEKEFGGEHKIYELYSMVHRTLSLVFSQRESQYTSSLAQLISSLTIASSDDAKRIIRDYGDVLATTVLQGGGKGEYTLVSMEPLPVSDLVSAFSMLDTERVGLTLPRLRWWVVSLALAGFEAPCSLAVESRGSPRTGGEEVRRMRDQIATMLEKYASSLILYARTGCKDLAYAAAREAWALARTEDARKTMVCIGNCADKENPRKCVFNENWKPLVALLEDLAEAAARLASVEVRVRHVY